MWYNDTHRGCDFIRSFNIHADLWKCLRDGEASINDIIGNERGQSIESCIYNTIASSARCEINVKSSCRNQRSKVMVGRCS